MKKLTILGLAAALPILAACTTNTVYKEADPAPGQTPPGQTPSEAKGTVVGPEGAVVEGPDGVTLTIPAGALAEETEIKITKTESPPPAQYDPATPVYTIEPAGTKLKKAGKLTFTKLPDGVFSPVIGVGKSEDIFDGLVSKAAAEGAVGASVTTLGPVFVAKTDCMDEKFNVKSPNCKPVPAPADVESGRQINGFNVSGFEYWQWKKPDPYAGGDEVAWGYNGDGEPKTGVMPTDRSRACMAESFRTLEKILETDPPQELKDLKAAKGVKTFWFWNNDMSDAKDSVVVPKGNSELWLFDGDRGDGGLIKWISQTERDGTCKLPTREDLVLFAKNCQTKFPKCGSGK